MGRARSYIVDNGVNIFHKTRDKFKQVLPYRLTMPRRRHRLASYSQTGEDLIIKHYFDSVGITKPSYIDIGAHDPFFLNNTALFYLSGSRGISIEPDPVLFEKFIKARPKDVNLNIGLAAKSGKLKFYKIHPATLNTFSESEAKKYQKLGHEIIGTQRVKVDTFAKVVKMHFANKTPDLLSIDVEGLDYEILATIDFNKYRPRVICAETIQYSRTGKGKKDTRIPKLLVQKGYRVFADTHINTIYVLNEEPTNR